MNDTVQSDNDSNWQNWNKYLIKLLGGEPQTKEELLGLLKAAKQREIFDLDALSMIEGVLQVSELQARDIMIPRGQIVGVPRDAPLEQILTIMRDSAHSRFPVIGEDRGEVIGLLLAKDIVAFFGRNEAQRRFNIRDFLRAAIFVPESKRLNVLLKEFKASHNHMAIVVDEYGNAAGLVTIEDVLEQIVGEIEDEHDFDEATPIFKRSQSEYTIKAHLPIDEFNQYFNSNFSEAEFDTIGGLVIHAIGHLPKRGEWVDLEQFRFKIMRADSRRVYLLNLRILNTTGTIYEQAPSNT